MNRIEYLAEAESRELLDAYLENLVGQQTPQYEDYLRLTEETKLPLAAGSLVMHHGIPSTIYAPMIQVESKAGRTSFHADVNTSQDSDATIIDSQHRPLRVGPVSRSFILFHHKQMQGALAGQQIWLAGRELSHSIFTFDDPEARRVDGVAEPERLAKFVDISASLVKKLLEATE